MSRLLPLAVFALLLLAALVVAACSVGQPTGPQLPDTALTEQPAGVLDFLATDTPTATPPPTATSTPTSTPTPLPTPTPLAALSVGSLPAGQVLFSTQRAGEAGQQLWRVTSGDGMDELLSGVLPGGWRCAAGQPATCAVVTTDQGLFALLPVSGTTTLLDDLTPVVLASGTAAISPTVGITATAAVNPTVALTSTAAISLTAAVTGASALFPVAPIAAAVQLSATQSLRDASQSPSHTVTQSPNHPITQSLPLPILALSPSGSRLAVATDDRVTVYDLAAPTVLATLDAGGPAELAWSPDGEQLALTYPAGAGNAIALWSLADRQLRVLAQMEAAGHLAWSPDGSKLAFDARTSPETPTSQGGQSDVYVLFLRSGEIGNLTELFLRNRSVDPSQQIGGWAPQWEADSETVRYVRGVPGQVAEQNVVRQPVRSRTSTVIWPAADEGKLGLVVEPGGQRQARVIVRDGRDVVQLGLVERAWLDATPGTFADLTTLAWSPGGGDEGDASRYLLLADRQTLLLIDPATGNISGLAVACPDCLITDAVWLPLAQE